MNIVAAAWATVVILLAPVMAPAATQPSIGIDAVDLGGSIQPGDQFVVPITVSDVPASTGLGSWQFDLSFDPTILSATGVTEGAFLSSFGQTLFIPPVIDDAGGQIIGASDFYIDLPPEPYGSGVLAEIDFTALAQGTSPLALANVFLDGSDSGFSMPAGPVPVPVGAPVSPPLPAPEPSSVWLLAVGALLLTAGPRITKELLR